MALLIIAVTARFQKLYTIFKVTRTHEEKDAQFLFQNI